MEILLEENFEMIVVLEGEVVWGVDSEMVWGRDDIKMRCFGVYVVLKMRLLRNLVLERVWRVYFSKVR